MAAFATAEACDSNTALLASGELRALEPIFKIYGQRRSFSGPIVTLKVFEDNVLVRQLLETRGEGRVLVIDGGGSKRCALVGGNLAQSAQNMGWSGIVVNGCIRDVDEINACDIGVRALGSNPLKSNKKAIGEKHIPISIAGSLIRDGEWLLKRVPKPKPSTGKIKEKTRKGITMASSSSRGLTFKLHPLVIVNISDHYTRVKSQLNLPPSLTSTSSAATSNNNNNNSNGGENNQQKPPRVYGCVIGVQRGRTVEIFNSFELIYDPSTRSLDRSFLEKKQELYKKVFPHFYVLGWYSTGSDAQESDMHFHKALMDINESPLYVLLNPAINPAQKDLPVTIYESELHVIDGVPQLIFVRSSYTIETVEAERISVDHVAHLKPSGGSAATQLAAQLTGIHSAIKMLNSRIRVLHQYLVGMQKGDIPCESSLLRQVSSLLRRLPAIESEKFQDDFLMEYNDTLLITYLAMFTNCSSTMNELVDKFNTAYDRHSRRGGRTAFI
ncbi:hypothetical protein V6Z11_D08G035200 [Gossypium hirsutum]